MLQSTSHSPAGSRGTSIQSCKSRVTKHAVRSASSSACSSIRKAEQTIKALNTETLDEKVLSTYNRPVPCYLLPLYHLTKGAFAPGIA